jgi:ribosomal-protein-alanine N-acetyltransferase
MYKKYGFEMVGVRPGYYKDNNEDALLMNLEKFDCLEAV